MPVSEINQPEFWEKVYQRAESPGWALEQPAPPFVSLLTGEAPPAPGKIAVLGCGTGYEVALFAEHGFDVVGVDFAPSAIRGAKKRLQRANLKAELRRLDIFDLPGKYQSHFDYVLEHTCFCAIEPARRAEYVRMVRAILKPTGALIALFFTLPPDGRPPFGTTAQEIRSLFEPAFEIARLYIPPDSIERRRGKELFAVMKPLP
ncbi:MAG: methyltransferase domain-containing protein [Candidatus Poribacteria bacterium]|nr:methyltransferase domain-containing protein [Candidatus Poribacteria bacterium]